MKEYVNTVILMNKEYEDVNKLIKEVELYILDKKPVVTIENTHYLGKNKTKKKKKDKVRVNLIKNQRVRWLNKNEGYSYGIIIDIKDDTKVIIKSDKGNKVLMKNNKIEIVEENEPEPEPEPVAEIIQPKEINYHNESKEWKWLSTFNKAKPFIYEDNKYYTVEHAFQAQKLSKDDIRRDEYQDILMEVTEPEEAKNIGNKQFFDKNNFILRPDWNDIKLELMEKITHRYYITNKKYMTKLIETDDHTLIYTGPKVDGYWGINKQDNKNHHGKILMNLREIFKQYNFETHEKINTKKIVEEGDNVKWVLDGEEYKGVVLKIDKRMKKNVNVMNSNGDKVKVKKDILIIQ